MKVSPIVGLVLAMSSVPALALAWKRQASIDVTVHSHQFTRVTVENAGCTLRYRLDFLAPAPAYAKRDRHPYRFHARLRFQDGRSVVSPAFANGTPGERAYTQTYDTSGAGCWAARDAKLSGVDVEACRGKGCSPDPFQ